MSNPKEMAHAYKFLANYNLKKQNFEEAYIAAQKCIDYPEVCNQSYLLSNHWGTTPSIFIEEAILLRTLINTRHFSSFVLSPRCLFKKLNSTKDKAEHHANNSDFPRALSVVSASPV